MRLWAHLWLCDERRHKKRRPKPSTPKKRRDSLEELSREAGSVAGKITELSELLYKLPDEARDLLAVSTDPIDLPDITSPLTKLAPDTRLWAEGRNTLRTCYRDLVLAAARLHALASSAQRGADVADDAVRPGAPKRDLGDPIRDLACIWLDATGHPPTRTWDEYSRHALAGRFRAFVYAAIAPLWPEAGTVDGLIDGVCTEFRSRCGELAALYAPVLPDLSGAARTEECAAVAPAGWSSQPCPTRASPWVSRTLPSWSALDAPRSIKRSSRRASPA